MRSFVPVVFALIVTTSLLAGCAGRQAGLEGASLQPEVPLKATVARSFVELSADSYPELSSPPKHGVTVKSLRASHDTHLFTEDRARWGRGRQFNVLEFTDSDRPTRSLAPTAAWFLGPDPGDGAPEVVGAVLFRDFDDGPLAADPHQLLAAIAERFPSPWLLCHPTSSDSADLLIAFDADRGVKLALLQGQDGEQLWSVDHVEFVSTLLPLEEWWVEKGYGSCPVEDAVH